MPRTTPDDWGANNRVYPPSSGKPGPRDPHYTPYMIAFGRAVAGHQYKRVVGIVGSQMGKALALDTRLPTPSGWTTMGDVQPGDVLFDENGQPCRVTAVSPVMENRDCYRVTFCDGSAIIADAAHRWTVMCRRAVGHKNEILTLTTSELIERGVLMGTGGARFSIPLAGALDLPEACLPLSPYLLGIWLGDGNSRAARITVGAQDLDAMLALMRAEGVEAVAKPDGNCWDVQLFGVDENGGRAAPRHAANVMGRLRRLGVLRNKHIPAQYLRASAAQRMALLQGLMDTDGGLDGETASFCSMHIALARQVVELACSLGFRPRLTRKVANNIASYVVRFYAYRDRAPFRLARKADACPDRNAPGSRPSLNESRFIRSIVKEASVPVKCVAIDTPTHLYLAGDHMVPTHNTDTFLDVIGQRLDQRPVPILYVGPTQAFVTDQFEPRVMALLDEAPTLARKVARGKASKKVRKLVAGVPLRLAHAGSSSALKSDPAGLALVDEYDELLANVKGQGDPLGLIEARGNTYSNFTTAIVSTPSVGLIETEVDPESGLEFWRNADNDDIKSPIWRLFQEGTRYHWAWPCPHCGEYFIPRFKNLRWPERSTPAQARRGAFLCCPANGCVIEEGEDGKTKALMNERGLFVAPGQHIADGRVEGEPPESPTWSMWASALASPFVTWGERAEAYLLAQDSGQEAMIQTAINAGFGECYALGGGADAPEWTAVRKRGADPELAATRPFEYRATPLMDFEGEPLAVAIGADVQKSSIYYVVRGFGVRGRSWLLDYGQLFGPTDADEVWEQLWSVIDTDYAGVLPSLCYVDSGFRPDKKNSGSEHRVYAFARKHSHVVRATKGHQTQATPIIQRLVEVTIAGQRAKTSMPLIHLNSDFFKSLVHSRIRLPDQAPDAWFLPANITDDYCQQIVSEVRTISPTGKPVWVVKSRNNHFLDCEAMVAAAGYQLRVHNLSDALAQRVVVKRPPEAAPERPPGPVPPPAPPRREPYLGQRPRGWLR